MRANPVKRKLRAGEATVGTWLALGSPAAAELLVGTGFDWLVVDAEHSPVGWETVAAMVGLVAHRGGTPLVRVPWNTAENIKRALDLGAHGVVVPMVNSVEEAEAAVRAAKYPPEGTRSVGGTMRALRFGADPDTYLARANGEILVVIQAEHRLHLERARDIAAVPGVDAVFIGPNDLAASLGVSTADPVMEEAYAAVLAVCRGASVAAGIHAPDGAAARRRVLQGFRFVAAGSDAGLLERHARLEAAAAAGAVAPGPGAAAPVD